MKKKYAIYNIKKLNVVFFLFMLLVVTSCIKSIDRYKLTTKNNKEEKKNNSKQVINKIIKKYQSLQTYQDKILFKETTYSEKYDFRLNEIGNFNIYYVKDKVFKFVGNVDNDINSNYWEILKYANHNQCRIQNIRNPNSPNSQFNTYKYKQYLPTDQALRSVDNYVISLNGVYKQGLYFKKELLDNEKMKVKQLTDSLVNNIACYRFSTSMVLDKPREISAIDMKKVEEDTTFSKETKDRIKSLPEVPFEIDKLPVGSSIRFIYWFSQENYLLLKSETFINIPALFERYQVVLYQPIVNKEINENIFKWSEKDKK